jgi:hypothetical protein
MTTFADLHLKPAVLAEHQLPDIGYPVPIERLGEIVAERIEAQFAELLFWLQRRCSESARDFRRYEPAMSRLLVLLAPTDDRDAVDVMGDEWWLELGPVDLDGEVVAIQRDDALVVAIARRDDGRLRVAAYRPLDARSATKVVALAQKPDADGRVCMRENNWELALDASAGIGQMYAAEAGQAYLSYWQFGVGILHDRTESSLFHPQRGLERRRPAEVAIELGIHYELSGCFGC